MQKYNNYKKQYQNDQQTIRSFDKIYRKDLQANVINKHDYESLCDNFTKNSDETRNESFL